MAARDNYTFDNASHIPSPFNRMIPDFFRAWDNSPPTDDQYLSFFAPEARLSFCRVVSQGRDAIRALRSGLIHPENGPVVKCEHTLRNLFGPVGDEISSRGEFIVKGSNRYILKNGRTVEVDFAKRTSSAVHSRSCATPPALRNCAIWSGLGSTGRRFPAPS